LADLGLLARFAQECRDDPVMFVDTLLPVKTRKVVDGVEKVHEGQRKWLREAFAPINVLVPGNRFGKSTVVAMRHLWFAFTKFMPAPVAAEDWLRLRYETISLAYSSEQANIVFNSIRSIVNDPIFRPFVKSVRESPYPKITLYNGSVIHVRSAHDNGKFIDGFAYQYCSIDEAGYIDDLKNLMNGVIIMRLAGGGVIDLLGTPKGISSNGLYWYATRGLSRVKRYYGMRGSIYDNPFLAEDDIRMRDDLIRTSDPNLRRQVIEGDFVDYEGLAFKRDQRENMFRESLTGHTPYVEGHDYVQAWDLGRRTDWTVGITLDVTSEPWVLADFVRLNQVPWEEIYRQIDAKAKEYHVHLPRIDATGPGGDVIEEELYKRGIPVEGYKVSTGALKLDLINTLQTVLDFGREQVGMDYWTDEGGTVHEIPVLDDPDPEKGTWGLLRIPPITQLVDEFGVYKLDDKKLTQDCVMAVALACERAWQDRAIGEPLERGIY
jgi:hypothetical protein